MAFPEDPAGLRLGRPADLIERVRTTEYSQRKMMPRRVLFRGNCAAQTQTLVQGVLHEEASNPRSSVAPRPGDDGSGRNHARDGIPYLRGSQHPTAPTTHTDGNSNPGSPDTDRDRDSDGCPHGNDCSSRGHRDPDPPATEDSNPDCYQSTGAAGREYPYSGADEPTEYGWRRHVPLWLSQGTEAGTCQSLTNGCKHPSSPGITATHRWWSREQPEQPACTVGSAGSSRHCGKSRPRPLPETLTS